MWSNRRFFIRQALVALTSGSLFKYITLNEAWAKPMGGPMKQYFSQMDIICRKFLMGEIASETWRKEFNRVMRTTGGPVCLSKLKEYIEFSKIEKNFDFSSKGRSSVKVQTPLVFGNEIKNVNTKIIGLAKGHAIPPHAHRNMASASIVVGGEIEVSQFDLREVKNDQLLLSPIQKEVQHPGQWSVMTREKNNVHWFKAQKGHAFFMNINIEGLHGKKAEPGLRIDFINQQNERGFLSAKFISNEEAEMKYGKL